MYVPLQVFGHHSLRRGVVSPRAWAAEAAARDLPAVALTDRHAIMGSVEFVRAMRQAGRRPILGVDFDRDGIALTALARNRRGLAALHRAVGCVHAGDVRWFAILAAAAGDLVVLVADPAGLPRALGAFGDSLRAAIVRLPGATPSRTRRVAEALGIPCVAAGRVHFRDRADWALHRILRAMDLRCTVARLPPEAVEPQEACLLDVAAMRRRHAGEEGLLAATLAVAELCAVEMELDRPRLPRIPMPGGTDAGTELARRAEAGLVHRYGAPLPAAARERLDRELRVIGAQGFTGYFLIVADIVDFAAMRGIPYLGRGSAANSLVLHGLGVTPIDPLAHELVFERFLTASRRSLPDVDIDFCWRRRDEVIDYVYRRYGREHVATISTHVALKSRAAFREAAKAFGWPESWIREAAGTLPERSGMPVGAMGSRVPGGPDPARVLAWARRLCGLPRHLGMHPGGIVISDRPLEIDTALVPSAKGPLVTQHEMRAVEALGLVKIDLLGQRSLSTIGDAAALLAQQGVAVPSFDAIPDGDPEAAALLREGRSLGCFQIESPGMRRLLVQMRAETRADLVHAISLIRPGPASAGMKDAYVRRVRGEEPAAPSHPALEPVLARTLGIMLYQEDILRVCEALAGWSLEDGDVLRAALGKKKDPGLLAALHARYVASAIARGIGAATVAATWAEIGRFAAFSYCKAHASAYGYLAYAEAWLKSRHPAAFFCAVLDNHRGYYPDRVYVEEAQRLGVEFLLPDVNRSGRGFTLEEGRIRIGLGSIRSLREATLDRWEAERTRGPFFSLREFWTRVRPDLREARHLILAGAGDVWDRPRPELLWRLELLRRQPPETPGFFAATGPETVMPRLPDYAPEEKRAMEYALLGFVAGSASLVFGDPPVQEGVVAARDLILFAGRTVTCYGWCSASRRTRTADGRTMHFITLEDPTGPIEGVLFPEACARFGHRVRGAGPYLMRGRVELRHDAVCVHVEDFAAVERPRPILPLLGDPGGADGVDDSRDTG
jgi:DNA-directed DNA polymerase III PolC